MALSKSLILPILALSLVLANKVHSQADSTTFNFSSFPQSASDLIYQGDAYVPGAQIVSFTTSRDDLKPLPNSTGRVVYSSPVTFWQPGMQASFQTAMTFSISAMDNYPGDGITFFIVPVNSPVPEASYGGNFGIFDPLTGLAHSAFAVEFDYNTRDYPWNPNYRHIGININSRVSRNVTRFPFFMGLLVTTRIIYDSSTRTITALGTFGTENYSVSYVFDLKTILPQQVQVGISASTGISVSSPILSSWSFTSALVWDSNNVEENDENEEKYVKKYM